MKPKDIQLKRDIKEIFREKRPKPYISPLAKKMQRTTVRKERDGPVKTYTEEEILDYIEEMEYKNSV